MPVKARASDEVQKANHGKLQRKSQISQGEDHTKPGRAMYAGIHQKWRERVKAPVITRRLYGKRYRRGRGGQGQGGSI